MRFPLFGACLLLVSGGTRAEEGNAKKGGTFGWDMHEFWKDAEENTHKILDPIFHPAETAPPRTKREQMQVEFDADIVQIKARMDRIRATLREKLKRVSVSSIDKNTGRRSRTNAYAELVNACTDKRPAESAAYKSARQAIHSLSAAPGPAIGKLRKFSDRDFFILNGISWAEARNQRKGAANAVKYDMPLLFSFTWVMDVFRNRVDSGSFGPLADFGMAVGQFESAKNAHLFTCMVTGASPDADRQTHEQVLFAFRSFASPGHVGLPKDVLFFRGRSLYKKEIAEGDPWVSSLRFGNWVTEYEPPPCMGDDCKKFRNPVNDISIANGNINIFLGQARKKKGKKS